MNSDNVFEICNPEKIWSLEEANSLLPLLTKLSNNCDEEVNKLLRTQRYLIKYNASKESIKEIDIAVQEVLKKWGTKVVKLGCKYHSGYVLFNNGWGFYSWLSNELSIVYYTHYSEPLHIRHLVSEFQPAVL